MATPRKPKTTAKPHKRAGRQRDNDNGHGGWHASLYPPSKGYAYWRIRTKRSDGTWATIQVPRGKNPDDFFEQHEKDIGDGVANGSARASAARDMNALAARYQFALKAQRSDPDYIVGRDNLIAKWVLKAKPEGPRRATDGELPVAKWTTADSQRWISAARDRGLSAARVEDLGVAIAGLRFTAHSPDENGDRWLSPAFNPLEKVNYSRKGTEQGAHRDWIPEDVRPTTPHVLSLQAVVDGAPAWDWQPTQYRIGVWCGPRLGEQMAIRDIERR